MIRHAWRFVLAVLLLAGPLPLLGPAAVSPAQAAPARPMLVCPASVAASKPQTCAVAEVLNGLGLALRAAGVDVPLLDDIDAALALATSGTYDPLEMPLISGGTVACPTYDADYCARFARWYSMMSLTLVAAAVADATQQALEDVDDATLARICALSPTLDICEERYGDGTPYADMLAEAIIWFTDQPADWGPEDSHGVGPPPGWFIPASDPTNVTFILDPELITGTAAAPVRIFGALGTVANGTFGCVTVDGCPRGYWVNVWRTATQLCSVTGHISGTTPTYSGSSTGCLNWEPGDGLVAGYQIWDPVSGINPSFATYMARGQATGEWFTDQVGPTGGITPTIDYAQAHTVYSFANAQHAIVYHRIHSGSNVGSYNGATGMREYLQNYVPLWGHPDADGDLEFDYPFIDPEDDLPPHSWPDLDIDPEPETDPTPTTSTVPVPPTIPEYDPMTDPDSDTTLANRLKGMFENLGSMIGGAFMWLLQGIGGLLQWLVEQLWKMFRWLAEQLEAWFQDVIAALQALWNLLAYMLQALINAIGVLAEILTTMLGLILSAVQWVGSSIVSMAAQVVGMLQGVIDAVLSIPALILDGLEALFVPESLEWDLPECATWFPCSWVQELGSGMATFSGQLADPGACTAPGIGWSEFLVSFPPPPGCSAAGGSVALGSGASDAGDLFGYRVALRAASLVAFGVWFIAFVVSLTPWATRRHFEANPEQQTLF